MAIEVVISMLLYSYALPLFSKFKKLSDTNIAKFQVP